MNISKPILVMLSLLTIAVGNSAYARTSSMRCAVDTPEVAALSGKLENQGHGERDWEKNAASVEGSYKIPVAGEMVEASFKAEFKLIAKNGSTNVEGTYEIFNPYLKKIEILHQKSNTYNVIHILKNRVHPANDAAFLVKEDDTYGFGVHCQQDRT